MSNFNVFDANPDTHYTADWIGYQTVLRVDGSATASTEVMRNSGPALNASGVNVGSVWFQNNQVLASAPSFVPDLMVWRTAQLNLSLDANNNVLIQLFEGVQGGPLSLVSSVVDSDPNRILTGFQHIALGVTSSGNAFPGGSGNPIVHFDNITVAIPEPTSLAALALGGLFLRRRR